MLQCEYSQQDTSISKNGTSSFQPVTKIRVLLGRAHDTCILFSLVLII
jgi:hypothetical protein